MGTARSTHVQGRISMPANHVDQIGTVVFRPTDLAGNKLGEFEADQLQTIRALKQVGFRGFILPDHVPRMIDDTEWCHRGRVWTVGYIQGLISAVEV